MLALTATAEIIALYAAAALLPCFFLMRYVYRLDRIEKEPSSLLWKLFLGGICAAILAMILEALFTTDVDSTNASLETILLNAFLIGLFEESSKFLFLKKFSWKSPAFNYRFDGMVYAVFASLGFAAIENILYVCLYSGLSVAIPRALLAIPGHMSFGACMGIYYGRAKICEQAKDPGGAKANLFTGVALAVLFHTVYDSTLMIGTTSSGLVFVFVVLFIYFYMFWRIRREAATDEPIEK
jgi:RsiW-degrading membrane proteinase PrsW (M82 family)